MIVLKSRMLHTLHMSQYAVPMEETTTRHIQSKYLEFKILVDRWGRLVEKGLLNAIN